MICKVFVLTRLGFFFYMVRQGIIWYTYSSSSVLVLSARGKQIELIFFKQLRRNCQQLAIDTANCYSYSCSSSYRYRYINIPISLNLSLCLALLSPVANQFMSNMVNGQERKQVEIGRQREGERE